MWEYYKINFLKRSSWLGRWLRVRGLAVQPDDLGSVPGTHRMEGKN